MPVNLPQNLPHETESVQRHQSNSSWNSSSGTPSFQPVHLKTNPTNTMNTIQQDQQFSIGEWHVAASTSSTSQPHHHNVESSSSHVQQQQQELHEQWLLNQNWREGSSGNILSCQCLMFQYGY